MADLTLKEVGSRGGRTLISRYSKEELRERRSKGGTTTKERYGVEHYRELKRRSDEAKKLKKQGIDK